MSRYWRGQAFPEDHEGRENDSCLGCHEEGEVEEGAPQPTPTPTATLPPPIDAVPTPIVEPVLFADNSCITCHEQLDDEHKRLTDDWSESIHASRGVGCVSCHGGDPSQSDAAAAMSKDAGFLGPIPRERTPALCASCHSRVDLMRQYNLATDQFDQYWESRHGQALMEGDTQVATCFDCHGGHRVLQVSDPESGVYPGNEPAMCAGCHADSGVMSTYDIPTDQYESYQTSVHGMALARQDQRAPTCSTCHGKHGAAPPGLQQVANVCGQCHFQYRGLLSARGSSPGHGR